MADDVKLNHDADTIIMRLDRISSVNVLGAFTTSIDGKRVIKYEFKVGAVDSGSVICYRYSELKAFMKSLRTITAEFPPTRRFLTTSSQAQIEEVHIYIRN